MAQFVSKDSVVRDIWGSSDTILFIFAGAAAEFALNKAVDWLYFTGRLPADPLGRLFSTVAYARLIVFTDTEGANKAIDRMTAIHAGVENARGAKIPDWAYRDVLFMLIDYSIRSYELLERKLNPEEKAEVFDVFCRVGTRMQLKGLPLTYPEWTLMRETHLQENLKKGPYTVDLFQQYHKHLGLFRYRMLLEAQKLVVPGHVKKLLGLNSYSLLAPAVPVYKFGRILHLDTVFKAILLPSAYKEQINALDKPPQ